MRRFFVWSVLQNLDFSPWRFALVVVFLAASSADSFEVTVPDTRQPNEEATYAQEDSSTPTRGPYCGVYSLCGALKVLGHSVKIADLLEPRYVDSPYGSSLAGLKLAAEDHGAYATPVVGFSVESLRTSACPVILHVNGLWQSPEYDHWILYLGVEDEKARILDVPHQIELVPFSQLLAQWDNTGLLVSDRQISLQPLMWAVYGPFLQFVVVALGVIVAVNWIQWRYWAVSQVRLSKTIIGSSTEAIVIVVVAASIALGWHAIGDEGFFRNHDAVALVEASHISAFAPKLTADEFTKLLEEKNVVVVDARFERDFNAGHIAGAINVPINTTPRQLVQTLADIPSNSRIVVYCQSKSCQFAEIISSLLAFNGLTDVAIFPGGWVEWQSHHKSKGNRTP